MYYRQVDSKKVAKGVTVKTKRLPSVPYLLKKLQEEFNRYIRLRDEGKPCISCGRWGELQAGHYYNVGFYPSLRFNEFNTNRQCVSCNLHKHGNLLEYRKALLKQYGEPIVKQLDLQADLGKKKTRKWSRFELQLMINYYQQKTKELR